METYRKEISDVPLDDFSPYALWELRERKDLYQCDLAQRMTICPSAVCVAERKRCTFRNLLNIAHTLGYKVDVIIREEE